MHDRGGGEVPGASSERRRMGERAVRADCVIGQMLEASSEFPQSVAVFSLISPGKKEFTQSVSMMLTTRPEDVTDLFVDKLTPVLLEKGRREQEVS